MVNRQTSDAVQVPRSIIILDLDVDTPARSLPRRGGEADGCFSWLHAVPATQASKKNLSIFREKWLEKTMETELNYCCSAAVGSGAPPACQSHASAFNHVHKMA